MRADGIPKMKSVFKDVQYLLDPHGAVAVGTARSLKASSYTEPIVSLLTAHPCKFPVALSAAFGANHPPEAKHPRMEALRGRQKRVTTLSPDAALQHLRKSMAIV